MDIVVYAEASYGTNPGHMVIGQESTEGPPCYFGYRFDPFDLPPEFQPAERWREYLFPNAVPGKIVDESGYVSHLLRVGVRTFHEKRAECRTPIESRLPPREQWDPHGWYSFNPDDPHPGRQPCYNCVKWATVVANDIVEGFLPAVAQGRLKLILVHLQPQPA